MAMTHPRFQCLAIFLVAFSAATGWLPTRVDAFVTQPAQSLVPPTLKLSSLDPSASARKRSRAWANLASDDDEATDNASRPRSLVSMDDLARPWITSATSVVLATSLLFAGPLLLPPPAARAAPAAPPNPSSRTATSINIDLRSLPALTRRVIVNRDKLTNYLLDSLRSLKPILDVLSESDAVTVAPPEDVKGAINQALTRGDARFLINGDPVDVRVESVPGVILVRVTNPRIPRLPFLRDGTAALRFADGIVDGAPAQLERAADNVQAVEDFLSWGAPQKAPLQYRGSAADAFLSSPTGLGGLTRGEAALLATGAGVLGAYGASYAYYVALQEQADAASAEKKAKTDAAKKAKAEAARKAKADAAKTERASEAKAVAAAQAVIEAKAATDAKATAAEEAKALENPVAPPEAGVEADPTDPKGGAAAETAARTEADGGPEDTPPTGDDNKVRKRNVFKHLFRRGDDR